ncbi:branched-chain amino acid ABC transporter permease [Intrasporangium sp.]|uniref:branched-chain amino acid ABC transporter permease n=1 Tax=Intrasporangium sp. TaxID=1925024 RepID=UPI00293AD6A3|nr:branched-chain amino acid ABC transporter permease [Intrasporangium sp.]MDV3221161.1 branched-chain amino acid ABC transporter permease [Intrasporangium sp.]
MGERAPEIDRTAGDLPPEGTLAQPDTSEVRSSTQLVKGRFGKLAIPLVAIFIFSVPLFLSDSYWLGILNVAGTAAIAGVALNVLTGYAGQISLGHAFFVGIGAFTAQVVGGDPEGRVTAFGLPMLVWLPAAAVLAGITGALIAPFALRLKGPYLAIVSLGLVFLGIFIARNLTDLTGGNEGTTVSARATLGPLDFESLQVGSLVFPRENGMFLLIWGCLGIIMLFVANVMRSRSGRAMQAVRDHDIAAEVLGVRMFRTQANAFVLSAAIAGVAGALLALNLQYIRPDNFDVNLSVQYLAIIVIGGMASAWGPVLGALFVGLVPVVVDRFASNLPFMGSPTQEGLSTTDLQLILYGALIVVFLILESKGLVALITKVVSALPGKRGTASA